MTGTQPWPTAHPMKNQHLRRQAHGNTDRPKTDRLEERVIAGANARLAVYRAYECLPVQRTAELSHLAPPPSKDGNPHDIDTATEACIRNKIINAYVQYSSFEAEDVVDNVDAEVSVAAAFGKRAWGGSGNADEHWRYFFVAAANPSAPGHLLVPRDPADQPVASSTVEGTAVRRA